MTLLLKRLSPTFVQEAAKQFNKSEEWVKKALQIDIESGVCASVLAAVRKPVVRFSDYRKIARLVGRNYFSALKTDKSFTQPYNKYLIDYIKGAT